jgi:hypothetical protein
MAKTECYQCDTAIEVEDITTVHPLCEDCESEFDSWFESQLSAMK